jgi:regulator of RNase E activity RraA
VIGHLRTSPRGPGKDGPGAVGVTVELCGVRVSPGDLVCADADGVAILAAAAAAALRSAAEALEQREQGILAAIERGGTTVDIFGLKGL